MKHLLSRLAYYWRKLVRIKEPYRLSTIPYTLSERQKRNRLITLSSDYANNVVDVLWAGKPVYGDTNALNDSESEIYKRLQTFIRAVGDLR